MKELFTALAKFQSQIGSIPKNCQGHGYKYADLDSIWTAIRKPLADNGLCVVQCTVSKEGIHGVKTILGHTSGELIEFEMYAIEMYANEIPQNKRLTAIQAIGSDLTYIRRYSLSGVLSITSDEDTDGAWIENQYTNEAQEAFDIAKTFDTQEQFTEYKNMLLAKYNNQIPKKILDSIKSAHHIFTTNKAE